MKTKDLFVLVLLTINLVSFSQSGSFERYEKIKEKSLFIHYEYGEDEKFVLKFFTDNEDNKEPLKNIENLGLKYGFTNIYMLWLNPLKYELSWKDSIYIDTRDKTVSDFIELLASQFGARVMDLNKEENKRLADNNKGRSRDSDIILRIEDGYTSTSLMELYFRFIEYYDTIQGVEAEVYRINQILAELKNLDTCDARIISKEVNEAFLKLFSITDPHKVNTVVYSIDIDGWNKQFKEIDESTKKVEGYLEAELITSDDLLNLYSKNVIINYLAEVKKRRTTNKKLVKNLMPFIVKIEKSISDESNIKDYYYIRDIHLEAGKALNTEIKVNDFEISKAKFELSKKSEIYKSKVNFVKHDWIYPFVSVGIFYSNTELRGFGVSTNDNGELMVAEDDVSKNSPVAGLFLNFQFTNSSRYLAPIIQLGIDPTKTRPFLLAGGGISIPSAKFAITGGVIWTWYPSLTSYSVGDVVESTLKLEEDIAYKFSDIKYAGGYIGIQYNF